MQKKLLVPSLSTKDTNSELFMKYSQSMDMSELQKGVRNLKKFQKRFNRRSNINIKKHLVRASSINTSHEMSKDFQDLKKHVYKEETRKTLDSLFVK